MKVDWPGWTLVRAARQVLRAAQTSPTRDVAINRDVCSSGASNQTMHK